MQGPLFIRMREEIERSLTSYERVDDVEALYDIIVSERRRYRDLGEIDEQIALTALCFFSYPGKTPPYKQQIATLRLRYVGIADESQLKLHFRSRLKSIIRRARTLDQLRFERLSDVLEDDEGERRRHRGAAS